MTGTNWEPLKATQEVDEIVREKTDFFFTPAKSNYI